MVGGRQGLTLGDLGAAGQTCDFSEPQLGRRRNGADNAFLSADIQEMFKKTRKRYVQENAL